jgi:hypothetical protein
MRHPRRLRPLRQRIFVGCEGLSEVGYIAFIRNVAEDQQLPIHLEIKNLAPAGDPFDRVNEAVKRIARLEHNREKFSARFVILDDDQNSQAPERAGNAKQLAQQNSISLIWQSPCHEAILLRHFQGHANDRPPTSAIAEQQLKSIWPEYTKPMERRDIGKRLDIDALKRATAVEPDLFKFLARLGLINQK